MPSRAALFCVVITLGAGVMLTLLTIVLLVTWLTCEFDNVPWPQ